MSTFSASPQSNRKRKPEIRQVDVGKLFEKLPPRQREIFDLVDLQGLSPSEAAERTGMKPVSIRANLFKARKAIRESLLATHPSYSELSR